MIFVIKILFRDFEKVNKYQNLGWKSFKLNKLDLVSSDI